MTAYAIVETALARLHGADETVQRGAFRGRLKHLQRLGLPLGDKPGKGSRIDYSQDQIAQFAVALELSECGIDPTTIINLLSAYWEMMFEPWIKQDNLMFRSENRALAISVRFMSSRWRGDSGKTADFVSIRWVKKENTVRNLMSKLSGPTIVLDLAAVLDAVNEHILQAESKS